VIESSGQLLGIVLGLLWGIAFAAFLQWVPLGRYIVERVTWLAVIIGVGVDLLIVGPFIGWQITLFAGSVVASSAIGIIVRSLSNANHEHVEFEQSLEELQ
jgi:hypothetical protein